MGPGTNMATVKQAMRYDKGEFLPSIEQVCPEVPLQISLRGISFTVTMRSPGADGDLVRGLLLTENLYDGRDFTYRVTQKDENDNPIALDVHIPKELVDRMDLQSRSLVSNSSCGICGKRELKDIYGLGEPLADSPALDPKQFTALFQQMAERQTLFHATGAAHAAAAFTQKGNLIVVREDIGRHNAVDKVVGYLLGTDQLANATTFLVSGRVSYEIVLKAYRAGIKNLAAVSAPSSLAIDMASEMGIRLWGYCRGEKATQYSGQLH